MPTTFDKVSEQPTLLLSQRPYIPYGDVTVVYGEGSLGKGRSIASIIGAVTTGRPVGLDTDADAPGDVIVMLPEDKPGEQVVGRLIAAGADLSRVHDLTRLDGGTRFKFSANAKTAGALPVLRSYIDHLRRSCLCGETFSDAMALVQHLAQVPLPEHGPRNPRLVVGDPVTALVGDGTIQTNKGARAFIEPIQDLADDTGVAVVLVMHPTKAGKLQGSGAIRDAARVVLRMRWDEVSKEQRVVEVEKGNNVPPALALPVKFTIEDGEDGRPRVRWLGGAGGTGQSPAWREKLQAEKTARAVLAAKAAVTSVPLPGAASPAGQPWRAIRWDKAPGGQDTPSIAGDAADEAGARQVAEGMAGRKLLWGPSAQAGIAVSTPVYQPNGTLTVFAVYKRGPAAAAEAAA